MALLDGDNFIRDVKYYKNNQLKYMKKKEISTQTDNNILFEELYNQIISKIETEYILQKRIEQDNDQEQELDNEQDNDQEQDQYNEQDNDQEQDQYNEQDNNQEYTE